VLGVDRRAAQGLRRALVHAALHPAKGRWDAAYAPIRSVTAGSLPLDLRKAIDANPKAKKTLATLNRMNLFALAFRTNNMKTPAGRAKKIAALVATLARGEVIVRPPAKRKAAGWPRLTRRGE
jgi:uncharacterized protein YdeI (YjbR/CyaY-like superfamily)